METTAHATGHAPEHRTLRAPDGQRFAATLFPARGERRGKLLVAGATAVPQGFYRAFAVHASARGYDALTLDYRGIGRSRPATLQGFEATFFDWARLDLTAAVDALAEPGVPLFYVGHSFGGHALGLLPHPDRISGAYLFGMGAGWHGWMPPLESLRVRLLWSVILPILVAWKGYVPSRIVAMGEDLPLGVYRDWRRWCSFPHYFFDDPAQPGLAEEYARVRTPIAAANSLDDRWAPPRSRDAFLERGYGSAPVERIDLDPRKLSQLGHMGYFRRRARPLWDLALEWLEAKRAGGSTTGQERTRG